MNLFLYGTALTIAGLALVRYGRRSAEGCDEGGNLVEFGYAMAIWGPFLLLCYLLSLPKAMLIGVAVSGCLWGSDQLSLHYRGRRLTSGASQLGSDFFCIAVVLCLVRFFVIEPFVVPSSSMRPTLVVDDFILVDKFSYGLRIPVINKVFLPTGQPTTGDVLVFENPMDRSKTFVKRVVGVPGDVIDVVGKSITINGTSIKDRDRSTYSYLNEDGEAVTASRFEEVLGSRIIPVLYQEHKPWMNLDIVESDRLGCKLDAVAMHCVVPENHYFVMGDNRDSSVDSRYWGFVPDDHILGRADAISFNLKHLSRWFLSLR